MIKFRLFKSIALIVVGFGAIAALLGTYMIRTRVIAEAQDRVRLDMNSAWAVYNSYLREKQTVLRLAASKQSLLNAFAAGIKIPEGQQEAAANTESSSVANAAENSTTYDELRFKLNSIRSQFGFDFLTVTDHQGQVILRTANPEQTGGFAPTKTAILKALGGVPAIDTVLFHGTELEQEGSSLAEQAFLPLRKTAKARPTPRDIEDRGMVMLAAVPIKTAGQVLGTIYGGTLINRNTAIVDDIHRVVYEDQAGDTELLSAPGSVTIFLADSRIATTIRNEQGNRAYGTRVSAEVAETVLDNNRRWIGRAFVVNDWYLSAYAPIKNLDSEVIGMLYVGILEEPYNKLGRNILTRYAILSAIGLMAALAVALFLAGRLSTPLHRLAEATQKVRSGEYPEQVPIDKHASRETASLIQSFNTMAETLQKREAQLRQVNQDLKQTNEDLNVMNHNYMETVEFVTHELKRPVASMVNYVYMLDQQLLGELNEKQTKAVNHLQRNLKSFSEMIRHYLNLARIENNEMNPAFGKVDIKQDIVDSAIHDIQTEAEERNMDIDNQVESAIVCQADVNMIREVFDNLLSNAVKYGRDGGKIGLRSRLLPQMQKAEFSVWNEGQGIPDDKRQNLFRKFSRIDEAAHQKQKGTGLGLFISKQIVEAHNGSIEVDSNPGEWAEFKFTLPLWKEQNSKTSNDNKKEGQS